MKHVGDITKLSGYLLASVDVVTGGSPCQDLSVAGKRSGLAGERSGLFMEQIRLIKELRAADEQCSNTDELIRPRYMVWENVPGALSSNRGEDFRVVLEETARIVCQDAVIPRPPDRKWRTAGAVMGDGWSIAWRILDAQFWGVPQRRRRIALVADFGGQSAPEILFVREGVRRDFKESRAQRQSTTGAVARSAAMPIHESRERAGEPHRVTESLVLPVHDKATRYKGGGDKRNDDGASNGLGIGKQGDPSPTLDTCSKHAIFVAEGFGETGQGYWQPGIQTLRARSDRPSWPSNVVIQDVWPEITGSIVARADSSPCTDRVQPFVAVAAGFKAGQGANAGGIGYQEEIAPALVASPSGSNMVPAVTIYENHSQDSRITGPLGISPTVSQKWGTGGNNTPIVMSHGQSNAEITEDISPTLNCNHEQPIVAGLDCRNGTESRELCATIQANPGSLNSVQPVRIGYQVRRLTPLECERLQGYPDGWTDIPEYIDGTGKKRAASDTARYKALGNSIALPPWKWVLKRIAAQYERDATLGSLFDGIGGFPYLWEQINGKGSALWASEIEPFCIAVTKYHFSN